MSDMEEGELSDHEPLERPKSMPAPPTLGLGKAAGGLQVTFSNPVVDLPVSFSLVFVYVKVHCLIKSDLKKSMFTRIRHTILLKCRTKIVEFQFGRGSFIKPAEKISQYLAHNLNSVMSH
jgi:hypothetical protein